MTCLNLQNQVRPDFVNSSNENTAYPRIYINAGVGDYGRSLRGDAEIAFKVGQRPEQKKHQYSVETPCFRNSVCGCLGLLHGLNPIFGETTIPRHDHAAVQQRRGDDEAVGGILVNLRQRRGVKHDGVIER